MKRVLIIFLFVNFSGFSQEKSKIDKNLQFLEFLKKSLENEVVNTESTKAFYQRSWAYWMERKLDYNQNPEQYSEMLLLFHQNQQKYIWNNDIKIDRFEDQIENFRRFDNRNTLANNPILFIGSSSIVYWETSKYFPDYPIINRGFGGASIPEIIYYFNDIIKKHSPSIIIVYCDIDIENGKSPTETVNVFSELVNKLELEFPQTEIIILSMKPTLIDDFLGKNVKENKVITNIKLQEYCTEKVNLHYVDVTKTMYESNGKLRSDIFLSDGMHLNSLGYELWNPIIIEKLKKIYKR
ncbi:SGNH/GDSL hydrolase family protein [Formosa maritima]|uniref:SGNH hydrolase-type esterase domain-containing protein n=1 Tax=Formosa maritima TaxID=2592046 RepID=A0A5D0GP32_9FLAO|nr:hypothetical protein [Formosa maritima]TYA59292.1 hypothetical protein FVF61_01375 [Formosa maritima]